MATVKANETAPVREPADRWSIAEAGELYDVASWGKGYFAVGPNGHVWVRPDKDPARGIDLKELVDNLQLRGISLPILIRFGEIVEAPAITNLNACQAVRVSIWGFISGI